MTADGDNDNSDHALVGRAAAGNATAFRALVERHQSRVFNVALRMTGDEQAAEEIAQETFFRLFRGLHTFRHQAALGTWLYRVAVNLCRDHHGRHAVELERTEEQPMDTLPEGPMRQPDRIVERRDLQERLTVAIGELSEGQREVVVLHYVAGLAYPEIAQALGVPIGTVCSRLYRALRELAPKVGNLRGAEDH